MCFEGSYMHCARWFVQGKKFSILFDVCLCNANMQLQCSFVVSLLVMYQCFFVEVEFVLCKLCCIYCSCTVSMHAVLFYSACWKRHITGDLSTAGTTACTVMSMWNTSLSATVVISTATMGIRNLAYCQPDKPPLIASVLTKYHRPGTLWRKKNCWGTW